MSFVENTLSGILFFNYKILLLTTITAELAHKAFIKIDQVRVFLKKVSARLKMMKTGAH